MCRSSIIAVIARVAKRRARKAHSLEIPKKIAEARGAVPASSMHRELFRANFIAGALAVSNGAQLATSRAAGKRQARAMPLFHHRNHRRMPRQRRDHRRRDGSLSRQMAESRHQPATLNRYQTFVKHAGDGSLAATCLSVSSPSRTWTAFTRWKDEQRFFGLVFRLPEGRVAVKAGGQAGSPQQLRYE